METHRHDATSNGGQGHWEDLSAQIQELGRHLRDTYRRVAGDGGPDEEEIRQAFATLAAAWDHLSASVSGAVSDAETRALLKQAAGSFATAFGSTITGLGAAVVDGDGQPPHGDTE